MYTDGLVVARTIHALSGRVNAFCLAPALGALEGRESIVESLSHDPPDVGRRVLPAVEPDCHGT